MAKPLASFEELNDTLWLERRALEHLLFKLVLANLMLAADDRRFVTASLAEIDCMWSKGCATSSNNRTSTGALLRRNGTWLLKISPSTTSQSTAPRPCARPLKGIVSRSSNSSTEIECMTQENRRTCIGEHSRGCAAPSDWRNRSRTTLPAGAAARGLRGGVDGSSDEQLVRVVRGNYRLRAARKPRWTPHRNFANAEPGLRQPVERATHRPGYPAVWATSAPAST